MKQLSIAILAAILGMTGAMAAADSAKKSKGKNKGVYVTAPGCPPGLAKKNPPCIPPGQARSGHRYGVGDLIYPPYNLLGYPGRYDLNPYLTYYVISELVYAVDPDTLRVLAIVGLVSELLD